jgi:hypothetical protein
MRPALRLVTVVLLVASCSFDPAINPLAIQCQPHDRNGCPADYTCSEQGSCCADRNDDKTCDGLDAGADHADTLHAQTADGDPADADGPDADAPEADGAEVDVPQADVPVADVPQADGPEADGPDADGPDAAQGACVSCSAGTKKCGPGAVLLVCYEIAAGCMVWTQEKPCGEHQQCISDPEAHCDCGATICRGALATGDRCDGDQEIAHCAVDGDGCGYTTAANDPCPMSTKCEGGKCVCRPASALCTSGQSGTVCESGKVMVTCGYDPFGCFGVTSRTRCPGDRDCKGNAPGAHCDCAGAASPECPGVGRVCHGGTLTTCTVDASGCLSAKNLICSNDRLCTGMFASADCRCGPASSCVAAQTIGPATRFDGQRERRAHVLMGTSLTFDGAFVPRLFGLHAIGSGATPGGIPRHVTFALYSSDAAGEPDRLVANTAPFLARPDALNEPYDTGVNVTVLPKTLPSGTYWLMVGFNVPTVVYEDTLGAPVPFRSFSYQVDFEKNAALPDPFSTGQQIMKSMAPAPNHYLTIEPQ